MENRKLEMNSSMTEAIFRKYMLPSIFALMASNLSSMIDTVIIGHSMAEKGLAAMSFVSPVYLFYFTVGSMIAVGTSIMAGIALGANEKKRAEAFFGAAFLAALVLGILFTVVGLCNLDRIVKLLGASGELYPLVRSYCLFYIAGGTCTLLFYVPFNYLKLIGRPQVSMYLLITMSVINMTLTWVLVRHTSLSTGGAALATMISLGCAFLLGCYFLFYGRPILQPHLSKLCLKDILKVVSSGSAAACNNLSIAVVVLVMNHLIRMTGTQEDLTIYAIAKNIDDFFMTIIFGISQAVVPIISLYYGERDNLHIRKTMTAAKKSGIKIAVVNILIIGVFEQTLIQMFGVQNSEILESGGKIAVMCVAASLIPALYNCLYLNYYSAVRKPVMSNVILLLRTSCIIGFACFFGIVINHNAIWLCYIAGEAAALLLWKIAGRWYGILLSKREKQQYLSKWMLPAKNDDVDSNLFFSVLNQEEDITFASEEVQRFGREKGQKPAKCMKLAMAVEELLVIIYQHNEEKTDVNYADVRIYIREDTIMLRIRYPGKRFNPIEYYKSHLDDFLDSMGIGIIVKFAESIQYSEVLGVNNLVILL